MRPNFLILLLAALLSYAAAESAPTFCKCTCFTNSTIVRLGPKDKDPSSSPPTTSPSTTLNAQQPSSNNPHLVLLRSLNPLTNQPLQKRAASSSCSQCTRAFCLNYNLPICKGAEEKDVLTMCFQRDSRKDQIIVWAFLLGTMGLLGWSAFKRVLEMRDTRRRRMGMGGLPGGGAGGANRGSDEDRGTYIQVR